MQYIYWKKSINLTCTSLHLVVEIEADIELNVIRKKWGIF